jgi:glycosyltransferase involved in cell wall biosynthesis
MIVLFACVIGFLFTIPWILMQRRIWNHSVRGSRKALILRRFTLEKLYNRGNEQLLPFRNPSIEWMALLDPASASEAEIKITDDLCVITWKSPEIVRYMEMIGLVTTSIIFRELVAVFKLTSYCVAEQIGVLRAYKHHYPALRCCLVSGFIKIPFIVDITGNYELIRRLTGKTFYLRKLNKIPFVKIFARRLTDWLLGRPLRSAFRVLGRNKNNYEHAFALGAPVDRLSLLRISNFSAAFNNYNPEQPPARPAKYPYILFVGRLAKINFPLDVIDAFNIAASQIPQYRLVIIGDGAIRDEVENRIKNSEYNDRIVFMGARPNDIVLNWTAHASVAICPYSGSTLVEAMLCGIPVIAYDIEWHSEIVIDDYTGFLVPFPSIPALAEKLIHVVSNYNEARRAAQNGRELARIAFDQDRIMKKESMYYKQALAEFRG